MEEETKNVTNVKEDDEVYIPIVNNCMLNLEVEKLTTCMSRVS